MACSLGNAIGAGVMLTLPQQLRVFAAKAPTDMRKSFQDWLASWKKNFGQQVEAGELFMFFSRRLNVVNRKGDCQLRLLDARAA